MTIRHGMFESYIDLVQPRPDFIDPPQLTRPIMASSTNMDADNRLFTMFSRLSSGEKFLLEALRGTRLSDINQLHLEFHEEQQKESRFNIGILVFAFVLTYLFCFLLLQQHHHPRTQLASLT